MFETRDIIGVLYNLQRRNRGVGVHKEHPES